MPQLPQGVFGCLNRLCFPRKEHLLTTANVAKLKKEDMSCWHELQSIESKWTVLRPVAQKQYRKPATKPVLSRETGKRRTREGNACAKNRALLFYFKKIACHMNPRFRASKQISWGKNFKPAAAFLKKGKKNREMSDAYAIRRGFSSSRVTHRVTKMRE